MVLHIVLCDKDPLSEQNTNGPQLFGMPLCATVKPAARSGLDAEDPQVIVLQVFKRITSFSVPIRDFNNLGIALHLFSFFL